MIDRCVLSLNTPASETLCCYIQFTTAAVLGWILIGASLLLNARVGTVSSPADGRKVMLAGKIGDRCVALVVMVLTEKRGGR